MPGGAAAYCAAAAAAAGAQVRLVACAGDDYPKAALDALARAGVDLGGIQRVAGPARRSRLHDPTGRNRALLHLADAGWWEATRRFAPPIPQGSGVFAYTAMPPHLLAAQLDRRGPGDICIADTSGAYASADPAGIMALVPRLQVFAPSREETAQLLPGLDDDAALHRLAQLAPMVVQKRGAEGLALARGSAPLVRQASLSGVVIDTTGAGDSVVGALAAGLARGFADRELLELCCRIAARTVAGVGLAGLTRD